MEWIDHAAWELRDALLRGETSCVEIMRAALARIAERELQVGAFITLRPEDQLLAEAEAVDRRRRAGDRIGPLAGLPIAVKDNICTKGLLTTCASKILGNFVPPYDATVIEKIRAADGIIVGKTNCDEFAMGSSTENSAMKTTRHPLCPERVPGGSSGGSAAALAAGMVPLALGSDTGGSIRQPASFCGVTGLKPTYGRVSRYGLVAYGSSLDQIGPMARSVEDVALLLGVIAGHDERDSTSLAAPVPDYLAHLQAAPKDGRGAALRFGVPREYFGEGLDAQVREAVVGLLERLRDEGHDVRDVSLPHTPYAVPTYYIIACAEASSNLARYDGAHYGYRCDGAEDIVEMFSRSRSEGFGAEVKRRIMLGTYVLSAGYYDAYYRKAAQVRTLIAGDFERAFADCDVILHPVAPTPAFRIGEKTSDPLAMYLGDIYSVTANLAGLPAISVPCGRTREGGLPVGVQLAARHLDEPVLLRAARIIEAMGPA
ncbi:MAG: Asp-tRNA(Asn)/Glu-tRNA(Gln) amidotransferase subunit GatA [Candidatus Sumerlaeia bacterium]